MKIKGFFLISFLLGLSPLVYNQTITPEILNNQWPSKWITVPGAPPNDYGVYLFRKVIDLKKVPATFVIHVSADNRYKLYVNEKLVSVGPARGDMYYWNFETLDIAPYLTSRMQVRPFSRWYH